MKKWMILLVAACLALTLPGCASKPTQADAKAITRTFRSESENAGFGVSTYYSDLPTDSAYIARKGECGIVLATFSSIPHATTFFRSITDTLAEIVDDDSIVKSYSSDDHDSYRLTTGDEYYHVVRAYGTILYGGGPLEYKEVLEELYKTLKFSF